MAGPVMLMIRDGWGINPGGPEKREENGKKGEARTEAFLLDSFWTMKRSVDVDGADFLVQEQTNTLEELRERVKKLPGVDAARPHREPEEYQ